MAGGGGGSSRGAGVGGNIDPVKRYGTGTGTGAGTGAAAAAAAAGGDTGGVGGSASTRREEALVAWIQKEVAVQLHLHTHHYLPRTLTLTLLLTTTYPIDTPHSPVPRYIRRPLVTHCEWSWPANLSCAWELQRG